MIAKFHINPDPWEWRREVPLDNEEIEFLRGIYIYMAEAAPVTGDAVNLLVQTGKKDVRLSGTVLRRTFTTARDMQPCFFISLGDICISEGI